MFLPMFRLESFYRLFDRCKILLIDEVSAVAATTLLQFGCIVIEYTLAALAVNARPVRKHKCRIDHPCLFGIWVGKTDPLMKFFGS